MSRFIVGLAIGFVLFAIPGVLRAGEQEDTAAIHQFGADFAAAWNRHDAKEMASFWADDGDLINPSGRMADGQLQVEMLFRDEHSGRMAGTTYAAELTALRFLTPEIAVADWDLVITGMQGPDGAAGPPFRPHLTTVMVKREGRWKAVAARPYQFLGAPPAD